MLQVWLPVWDILGSSPRRFIHFSAIFRIQLSPVLCHKNTMAFAMVMGLGHLDWKDSHPHAYCCSWEVEIGLCCSDFVLGQLPRDVSKSINTLLISWRTSISSIYILLQFYHVISVSFLKAGIIYSGTHLIYLLNKLNGWFIVASAGVISGWSLKLF